MQAWWIITWFCGGFRRYSSRFGGFSSFGSGCRFGGFWRDGFRAIGNFLGLREELVDDIG